MATTTLNFNAAFVTTPEITLAFAKFKGYQEEVNSPFKDENDNITGYKMVSNPVTPEEFVCNYMQNYIANELNGMTQSQAWADAHKAANEAVEAGLKAIKDSLTVELI